MANRIVALVLPIGLMIWIVAGRGNPQSAASPTKQDTDHQWVGFSANVRTVVPYETETTGRFWRDVDGSTRFDASSGQTTHIIINNIAKHAHFRLLRTDRIDGVWTRQPLRLPPDGWRPRRAPAPGRGTEASGEQVNGFTVIRLTGKDGTIRLLAERLDYFAVIEEVPGGRRTEYSDIVTGPQDRALFEPPAGATIKELDTPGGIVFVPRGKAGAK